MKKVIIGISLVFMAVFIYSCTESFEDSNKSKNKEIYSSENKTSNLQNISIYESESKEILSDYCNSSIGFGKDKCVKIVKMNYPISLYTGDPCVDCNNILVNFEGYVCWNWDGYGNITDFQVSFNKFEANPDPSCTALWDCWNGLTPVELVQIVEHFEYEASLIAELLFAMQYVGTENISPSSINFVYIRQNCYKTCILMGDGDDIIKTEYSCGNQCCYRIRRMSEIQYTDTGIIDWHPPCRECPTQIPRFYLSEPEFDLIGEPCEDTPNPDCMTDPDQLCEQICGPR